MKVEKKEELEDYYRQAGSWAEERDASIRGSRKIAWIVAGVAATIALIEAIALLFLMPLKTVVPYTLLVDRQTGFVQTLDPDKPNKITPDTALTQSFITQYVLAREGYDITTVKNEFKKVVIWSADAAKADYVNRMHATNPESPLSRLPRTSILEARIRSVAPLDANSASVRFEVVQRDRGGVTSLTQNWVAAIGYKFSDAPMSAEDRFINPLGFQVTRYSKNAETPPLSQAPQPVLPSTVPTSPYPSQTEQPYQRVQPQSQLQPQTPSMGIQR